MMIIISSSTTSSISQRWGYHFLGSRPYRSGDFTTLKQDPDRVEATSMQDLGTETGSTSGRGGLHVIGSFRGPLLGAPSYKLRCPYLVLFIYTFAKSEHLS